MAGATAKISGKSKAAIIAISLGTESAASVFKYLKEEEIEQLIVEISRIGNKLSMPRGRKYCLNFALADNYEVNAKKLKALFDPEKFMVKITPLHMTHACVDNNIKTTDGYEYFTPYQHVETELIDAGFDVLVFVPSKDEDEGRITCGNAILSGTMPECKYSIEN